MIGLTLFFRSLKDIAMATKFGAAFRNRLVSDLRILNGNDPTKFCTNQAKFGLVTLEIMKVEIVTEIW